MRFLFVFSIALLSLTSCQKEAVVETTPIENTTKTLVSFSTAQAVNNFISGKWSWKETIVKQRTGQTISTSPTNTGIQKMISLANNRIIIIENGVQILAEDYKLTKTDAGWLFEGGGCSGILYRVGDRLIIAGSVIDRADDYYERAQ